MARLVWTRRGRGKWQLSDCHVRGGDAAKLRAALAERIPAGDVVNVYCIMFDDEITQAAYDAVYPDNTVPEWAREWEVQP